MKKLIAIVSLAAFAVAAQAGDACCSKTKTSTVAAQDNHACCSKTMTSAQSKATCSASQTSCCSSHTMAKKTMVSHAILSPKAAASL